MLQLLALGLAGLLVGAALSAARRRAPTPVTSMLFVMAALALVLAVVTLPDSR